VVTVEKAAVVEDAGFVGLLFDTIHAVPVPSPETNSSTMMYVVPL
jgi:hypothetical protein